MVDDPDGDDPESHAPLYAIRQVGALWTVYDWHTLDPIVVRGVPQIGLDREVAQAIAEFMTARAGCGADRMAA